MAVTPDRHRRTATALRLNPDVHEALAQLADELDVSLNWVVNRVLTEALPRLRTATEFQLTADPEPDGRTAPRIGPG